MNDSIEEEFEPLFDYSRVQPTNFISLDDDLSDSENLLIPKRLKKNNKKVEPASGNVVKDTVCEIKDEEDWLPPPPKTSNDERKLGQENSTIKELRLKKQELASFAQSAEEVFRAVEESAKKHVASSVQASLESEQEKVVSKPSDDRLKIIISIQDKEGLKQFRTYMVQFHSTSFIFVLFSTSLTLRYSFELVIRVFGSSARNVIV
ncbi:Ubiquitin-like superfamily protein [Thalictrum thalictroides]|uniref:Ubiquitin-like superfamily protein n=1 Tax=Thalictrum thalictroides TaxID=46969 RepID=A0A7J6VT75_THATH|nr:Ubiquitin-like superfamily protein [Thalictrum thalictroides]